VKVGERNRFKKVEDEYQKFQNISSTIPIEEHVDTSAGKQLS
jgi:hypothetical protein